MSGGAIREGEGINIGNLPLRVVALSGRWEGINISNLPLRVVALSGEGGGGDQYRKPSPTIGGAIGEGGINIGNLPLRVMALSGRGGSI